MGIWSHFMRMVLSYKGLERQTLHYLYYLHYLIFARGLLGLVRFPGLRFAPVRAITSRAFSPTSWPSVECMNAAIIGS
jgi:hypothetical protein